MVIKVLTSTNFQVWSVRSCEGSLKKRGHCLIVNGIDARALIAPVSISGKLSVRRTPAEQLTTQTQPRAVLRVANRVNNRDNSHTHAHDLEPFLQDLQNDVARLSRAFATLGREATALVRSEAEMRARIERHNTGTNERNSTSSEGEQPPPAVDNITQDDNSAEHAQLSRNARRRMRQRLRAALNASQRPVPAFRAASPRQNGPTANNNAQQHHVISGLAIITQAPVPPPVAPVVVAPPPVPPPPVAPQTSSGTSNQPQNGNARVNKKKRRHRR